MINKDTNHKNTYLVQKFSENFRLNLQKISLMDSWKVFAPNKKIDFIEHTLTAGFLLPLATAPNRDKMPHLEIMNNQTRQIASDQFLLFFCVCVCVGEDTDGILIHITVRLMSLFIFNRTIFSGSFGNFLFKI